VRGVLSRPQIALLIVVTLALGVGMNAAIFSVVDAVLLKPLPYDAPDRLVYVSGRVAQANIDGTHLSAGDVRDLRESVSAFAQVAGAADIRQNLTGEGFHPRQISVGWTTPELFQALGVATVLGRPFVDSDPPGTVLLSYDTWMADFGGDRAVIGRTLRLDGHPHTVVGVLPPDYRFHAPGFNKAQVWKNPDTFWQNGDVWSQQGPSYGLLSVVARLKEGATIEEARQQVALVSADLVDRFPEYASLGYELTVQGLHDRVTARARPGLLVLGGAVGLLLLIACANVTNLLLIRAQARQKELVVRLALGSPRGRIARLVFLESLLLALAGGAAGAAVGLAATRVFLWLGPSVPLAERVTPDLGLLGFSLAVAAGCAVIVGLTPAIGAARSNAASVLQGSRGTLGGTGRLRRSLVVGQIALSLVLLIGAGLLTNSFVRLNQVDVGFDTDNLLTFSVTLPGARYERPVATDQFLRDLQDRLGDLPGVSAAGIVWPMPLTRGLWRSEFEGGHGGSEEPRLADYRVGTEEYFDVLGLPLREGRTFGPEIPPESVIISEAIAGSVFPGQSALGRTIRANPWGGEMVTYEVIGIVEDVSYGDLREDPAGALYFDTRAWSWNDWEFHVLVRTAPEAGALIPAVQAVLADMDPEVPMADAATMDDLKARQLASNRFALALMGAFSVVAASLALVGLYGLMSYSVRSRRPELGVRLALGSDRAGITRLVVREGLALTAWGIVAGAGASLLLTRLLATWLYGVESSDMGTYLLLSGIVSGAALCAAGIPALRAARLEPASV
ncbi:MAG: ABC transporter permease, partial [Gemmatimonadota bacterium]|nr:ABC transporter permease [Gemmatimonadota bacterium]